MKPIKKDRIISITVIAFVIALILCIPLAFKMGYLFGVMDKNVTLIYKSYILAKEEVKQNDYISITAEVSGYTSSIRETDGSPCRNAFGNNICNLHKAGLRMTTCPTKYKQDQLVEIEGIIYACFDRSNQEKYPDIFDIYFGRGNKARQDALDFGRKNLEVKIYE